jgi:hypothetical protein
VGVASSGAKVGSGCATVFNRDGRVPSTIADAKSFLGRPAPERAPPCPFAISPSPPSIKIKFALDKLE